MGLLSGLFVLENRIFRGPPLTLSFYTKAGALLHNPGPHCSCSSLTSAFSKGRRIRANKHCSLSMPTTYSSGYTQVFVIQYLDALAYCSSSSCLTYTLFFLFLKIGSYQVAQGVLEFKILLPQTLECWHYKYVLPCYTLPILTAQVVRIAHMRT